MTKEQLEMARTFTDKEVMSDVIASLRAITLNKLLKTDNDREKEELDKRQLLLEYEQFAVLGDDDIARSIQDKVIRFYAPLLRTQNEHE